MWVADYSFARPDPVRLKTAGCAGIVRYATGPGKGVAAGEITAALNIGLTVTIVQEGGTQPALRGYPGGVADAAAANAALDQVGYPADCWIYYVAEDPTRLAPSAWPTVDAYFHGVTSVGRRPAGGYGSKNLLDHLAGLGLITRKWAVSPWGGHDGCHLAQYAAPVPGEFTNLIDANLVLADDYGQTPRPAAAPTPPTPTPPPWPACWPGSGGQDERTTVAVCTNPSGKRMDMVTVNPDGRVNHSWTDAAPAWKYHENLGGYAKSVSCCWLDGNRFVVIAHGSNDIPYQRVNTNGKWDSWVALPGITLKPI